MTIPGTSRRRPAPDPAAGARGGASGTTGVPVPAAGATMPSRTAGIGGIAGMAGMAGMVAIIAIVLGWAAAEKTGLIQIENPATPANAAALAGALLLSLVLLRRPGAGLALLAAFVYLNLSQVLVREHGLPSLLQLLVLPIALAAASGREGADLRRLPRLAAPVLLATYTLVLLASTLSAEDRELVDDRLVENVKALVIFALVAVLAASPRRLRIGTWTVVAAGAFLAALGVAQVLTGSFGRELGGLARIKNAHIYGHVFEPRIAGPLGDPNFFAQILLVLVPLALTLAGESRRLRSRLAALGAAGLILAATVLTYSRGGALALGCVLLLVLVARRVHLRQVLLGIAALGLLVLLVPSEFTRRLTTVGEILPGGDDEVVDLDSSFEERKLFARVAWRIFLDHPLLGVGAGNYTVHYDRYADVVGFAARDYEAPGEPHYPHNLYLEIAAETGLVGLAVFTAAVAACFVYLRRARSALLAAGDQRTAALARAYEIALAGYLISSLFLHGHFARYLWLLFGFATALRLMAERAGPRPEVRHAG